MVLSGHNFLPDSKVVFVEKAPGAARLQGWALLGGSRVLLGWGH